MNGVLKWKWVSLVVWTLLTVLLFVTMPSLDDLVREKGQPEIESNLKSKIAADLQAEMNRDDQQDGSSIQAIVVYHNPDGLTEADQQQIEKQLQQVKKESELTIDSMLTPFDGEEARERLFSEDQQTMMATLNIAKSDDQTVSELREGLKEQVQIEGITTYLTGDSFINEDYAQTSLDGVKKTEIFAMIFIIAVLVFVFRSPITPVISLIAVGMAYLLSIGVVTHLVEWVDFPFANTTQIFLVLVLFGIGTDYNILLFMRFKEETARHRSIKQAIIETYRTAGKTVFYSGLAILFGFSMLGFSNFGIYQSGVAVAIGVVFLLLILFTIVPLFMSLLGKTMFWPSKKISQHQENPVWRWLGRHSIRRPVAALLVVALICVPIPFLYQQQLSFDSLQEVNPEFESVKGFRLVADSFGAGQTLPTEMIIKSSDRLDTPQGLALLDQYHQQLMKMDGVKSVYGPTRPSGERLDQLYSNEQTKEVKKGIDESTKGLDQIAGGLADASKEIGANTSGDMDDVGQLVSGTNSIRGGVGEVQKALIQIRTGLNQGATGATQLSQGIRELEQGMSLLNRSTQQVLSGYETFGQKMKQSEQTMKQQMREQAAQLNQAAEQIIQAADQLAQDHPDLSNNQQLAIIKQVGERLKQQAAEAPQSMNDLSTALDQLEQANQGLKQVVAGQKKLQTGAHSLSTGADQLATGLKQGASGQQQVIRSLSQIDQGLAVVNDGQRQLQEGLNQFESSMEELQKGLDESSSGIDQVSTGLNEANQYLSELTGNGATDTFHVPEEVREDQQFQDALDMYMSEERTHAKWTVVLDVDPYSPEAMEISANLDQMMNDAVKQAPIDDLQVGTGGISATNDDLQTVSSNDFQLTVILMLVGISLMLIILFRSFWISLFVMIALLIAYFSSVSWSEWIYMELLGHPGLSWTVPFFSFILIIAIGVDYSIFLLMRYKEYGLQRPTVAIAEAMKRIGGVVISAAIILCGTFAAMFPSGVATLVQIATVVIIALLLLAFLLLPTFLPATITLMDPQARRERKEQRKFDQS